jgi:hypothetical protein
MGPDGCFGQLSSGAAQPLAMGACCHGPDLATPKGPSLVLVLVGAEAVRTNAGIKGTLPCLYEDTVLCSTSTLRGVTGHWHVHAQSTHCRRWPAVLPSSPVLLHVSESVSPGAAPRPKSSLSSMLQVRRTPPFFLLRTASGSALPCFSGLDLFCLSLHSSSSTAPNYTGKAHRRSETRPRLSSDWSVWPGPKSRPKPLAQTGRRIGDDPSASRVATPRIQLTNGLLVPSELRVEHSHFDPLLSQPDLPQTAHELRRYKRQDSRSLASPPKYDPTGTDPPVATREERKKKKKKNSKETNEARRGEAARAQASFPSCILALTRAPRPTSAAALAPPASRRRTAALSDRSSIVDTIHRPDCSLCCRLVHSSTPDCDCIAGCCSRADPTAQSIRNHNGVHSLWQL